MKLSLLLLSLLVLGTAVLATIYQKDDRQDQYLQDPLTDPLGNGVGMLVNRQLVAGTQLLVQTTLEQRFRLCPDVEKAFRDQPSQGVCTGFVVGPDLVATAGSCMYNVKSGVPQCQDLAIVFNYGITNNGFLRLNFDSNEIYYCTQIVGSSVPREVKTVVNPTTGKTRTDIVPAPDWAVFRVDRLISYNSLNSYTAFRSLKNLHINEKTYTIGHPLGLPKKFDAGGRIWAIDGGLTGRGAKFFVNSDTFDGSAGSPVLDADGRVIGIHASGNPDFVHDSRLDCRRIVKCPLGITEDDDDCIEGELATAICYLAPHVNGIEPCETAVGNKRNLPPGVNENIHRFAPFRPDNDTIQSYEYVTPDADYDRDRV